MPLTDISELWDGCTLCEELTQKRKNIVFGDGSPTAKLLFVGEAPKMEEDQTGAPFVGRSGQCLRYLLDCIGLKDEEIYFENVVACRCTTPAGTDRVPTAQEIKHCSARLNLSIYELDPVLIVALGTTAFKRLAHSTKTISAVRGGLFHTEILGNQTGIRYPVVPTYHPDYLLRRMQEIGKGASGCWGQAERDLKLAVRLHDELLSRYLKNKRPNRQQISVHVEKESETFEENNETGN